MPTERWNSRLIVPFLSNETIRAEAAKFLDIYHSDRSLPVPVEEIIELKLRIIVNVIPGIKGALPGTDAYIDHDFTVITIDASAMDGNQGRLKFTLAHELGHMFLHKDIYSSAGQAIRNTDDFVRFRNSISDKDWRFLETQANKFASEIIFPDGTMQQLIDPIIAEVGGTNAVDLKILNRIITLIAQTYDVSNNTSLVQFSKLYFEIYNRVLGTV